MKDIFFSIITPVLNGEDFINDYIDSLRKQIYINWEAIIVDDNSEDETYANLKELTKNDKRFRIYKNNFRKNLNSPYAARNYGLTKSKGEYICFLDIDDFWYPEKLKSDYYILKKNDPEILIGNYIKTNGDFTRGYLKPRINFLNIKFQTIFCNPFPMLSTTVKKSIIGDTKFQAKYHEDYIFWREIIEKNKGNKININIEINKSYNALYRIRKDSLSFNRLKTINWLIDCYKHFNISKITIFFILLIRILLFSIEKFAISFRIIKIKNIEL